MSEVPLLCYPEQNENENENEKRTEGERSENENENEKRSDGSGLKGIKELSSFETEGLKTPFSEPIVPVAVIPNQVIPPIFAQPIVTPKASGKNVRTIDITTNGGIKLNNLKCECLCCDIRAPALINRKCIRAPALINRKRCCRKRICCCRMRKRCKCQKITFCVSTSVSLLFIIMFIFISIYMLASCEYFNLGSIGEYIIGAKSALICFI
jgi:hypothetical protein